MQFRKLYLFLCRGYLIMFVLGASYSYAANTTELISEVSEQQITQPLPQQELLNINEASVEEIAHKMRGVGVKKAKAIVDYRNEYGKFVTLDQLLEVPGIGEGIFEKNKEMLAL